MSSATTSPSSQPTDQPSALELYSRNIKYPPSLLEFRNQYHSFIIFVILAYVYTMYGQQIWSSLTATWNLDDLGYTASFILSNGLFWLLALFFFILDTMPERFNKYRVQSFRPVKLSDYKKAFVTAMVNTFLVSIPFGYPVHLLYKHLTRDVDLRVLPSPREVVTDHIAFIIILEIAFYYSHMLMHQPLFYKYIHKKHHEFVAPVAMAAVYAHPIEHIISNLTPIILGPIVMRSHIVTYWIWWMLTITGTMINHSCYCLPGMGSPVNHDFHHYMQQENFGVFGILDHLHHTDTQYLKMVEYIQKRNDKR